MTKVCSDPRYRRLATTIAAQLELIRRLDEADQEGARAHRAEIRQAIEAAWELEQARIREERADGAGFG